MIWRTEEWLEESIKSLQYFESLKNCIDTSDLNREKVANMIMLEQYLPNQSGRYREFTRHFTGMWNAFFIAKVLITFANPDIS